MKSCQIFCFFKAKQIQKNTNNLGKQSQKKQSPQEISHHSKEKIQPEIIRTIPLQKKNVNPKGEDKKKRDVLSTEKTKRTSTLTKSKKKNTSPTIKKTKKDT
ncbi:hypothetical protein [Candidatus Liberibacter sp.]|uniref:hypothetical protein n=1 Tax=Candidatus Liberibacter sp. TaxID=34022 RepID=UPI0015F42294|nr:hypothetical protein [Candidatus Liberibacter sp.]MBA5723807.1 hypothetical protein [Candidatus Liberibacter sp.]